ncbi:MAG: MFS transporter [Anaerolineae bacterium]
MPTRVAVCQGNDMFRIRQKIHDFLSPGPPISPVEALNIRYLYLEIAWWGIAFGTYLNYLPVFAARLGASNFWIGVLSSGPALVSIFWLWPAGHLIEHQRRQMPLLAASMFISRAFILLMALAPWLSPTYPGEVLAILVTLQAFPSGIVVVAFSAILPDTMSREHLSPVVSQRNAIIGITSTLGTLISVPLLAWLSFPINYQIVFVIGFVTAYFSAYYVTRLQVLDHPVPTSRASGRRPPRPFLSWKAIRGAWREQPAYSWYVLAAFVFHAGLYAAIPLFSIYWVRGLRISDTWIATISLLWNVASVAGSVAAPPLVRRWGNGRVLMVSSAALSLYPIGTALSRSPYPLVLLATSGGIVGGLMAITLFNRLIEVIPASRRASYVGLYNAVINVAVFAAPLVSTALADRWGVPALLMAAGLLRIFGGLLFGLSRGGAEDPASTPRSPWPPRAGGCEGPGG